ncbi:arginyltransferase [Oceaniserpentilla sp. 4NH20-0058]|uniref:arginyltransferase n=1 Tax=Oceaniserpentilla sp. 4NH20-0058 TaxID=3127660 RepID=UPI0031035EDE
MNEVNSGTDDNIRLLTLSEDHACSYLPNQKANSVFLDHKTPPSWQQYSQLTRIGFRRSGDHFYRPHCKTCDACLSCRVGSYEINLQGKRFKRILKKSEHLSYSFVHSHFTPEHYELYENYINNRHHDGDMYPPSTDQYKGFLVYPAKYSYFLEIRDQDKLIACCVTDALDDGLSAIYTYFDTGYEKYSLGTLAVLLLCKISKEMTLPYVYLGYWVKNSQKMHYKAQFKPLEIFNGENWQPLSEQV